MKSRISTFVFGMVVGAGLLLAAMSYHVVRASDGVHVIAKKPARLNEIYVDIRSYSVAEWTNHPLLASDLVQANKQYLLGDSTAGALQQGLNQLLPQTVR
jgi:hypothetical protein